MTYDDGILVLETPQSPQVSRDVIRTIHERHPNQRIRWAVPTRHHFDHSGGLFRYIEDGATVVTTEGNADFVRRVAQAPRTIGRLDRRAAPAPRIEVFAERRAFGEGTRRVELIDVGPNPHADEILIAFPELKTLFVADLYGFQGTVVPANQNALAFAERLDELNLEFDTVISVHGQRDCGTVLGIDSSGSGPEPSERRVAIASETKAPGVLAGRRSVHPHCVLATSDWHRLRQAHLAIPRRPPLSCGAAGWDPSRTRP